MTNYLLVGDLHSQLAPLQSILDYCVRYDRTPIFLGDVFDSRCDVSQTVQVYNLLRVAPSYFTGMRVLRSNHQDKLERYIAGNKVTLSKELQRTIADFEEANVSLQEVYEWLDSLPYGVVFRDSRGLQYRCSHAYFPRWVEVPESDELVDVNDVVKKAKQLMMYGPNYPYGTGKGRVFWWQNESQREWVRVAGHYHVVHQSARSLVLDGGCGNTKRSWFCAEPAILVAYDVESGEMLQFDAGTGNRTEGYGMPPFREAEKAV